MSSTMVICNAYSKTYPLKVDLSALLSNAIGNLKNKKKKKKERRRKKEKEQVHWTDCTF